MIFALCTHTSHSLECSDVLAMCRQEDGEARRKGGSVKSCGDPLVCKHKSMLENVPFVFKLNRSVIELLV